MSVSSTRHYWFTLYLDDKTIYTFNSLQRNGYDFDSSFGTLVFIIIFEEPKQVSSKYFNWIYKICNDNHLENTSYLNAGKK